MAHLMYSAQNDILLDRAGLNQVPTPPAMGAFHRPYSFGAYVDDVSEALDIHGIEVVTEDYAVTKDKQSFFGMMEIAPKRGELITADEWNLTLGLRGSHNQRIPRGLVLGSQVIVCSNLCFHGNIGNFKTKQTLNIGTRLPHLIRNAVSMIPDLAAEQEAAFDRMKSREFKPRWGDAALVDMFREGAFTAPQLARAINEWHEPSHTEHADYGWSLWRLLNASTEALKPTGTTNNMVTVEQRSRKVSDYITALAA